MLYVVEVRISLCLTVSLQVRTCAIGNGIQTHRAIEMTRTVSRA